MIVVTYHKETKEVISVVPISITSDTEVELEELDGIVADGYDYIIYNGTEPLFKDNNGVMTLDGRKILLYRDYLDE